MKRRGFLVPVSLGLAFVMMLLAFALQSLSRQQLRQAVQRVRFEQVQAAADAGLVIGLQQLSADSSYTGQKTPITIGAGPETATISVLKSPAQAPDGQTIPDGCVFVLSSGNHPNGVPRTSGALVRVTTTATGLKGVPGIYADTLTLSNGSFVNSYDSRTGTILPTNKGTITTNSSKAGSVQLLGGSQVKGSILIGPEGVLETNPTQNTTTVGQKFTIWRDWSNFYTSAATQTTALKLPEVQFPAEPGSTSLNLNSQSTGLAVGNYNRVEISNGARLTLKPGVYIFNELVLSGGAQISIAGGSPVQIYVKKSF